MQEPPPGTFEYAKYHGATDEQATEYVARIAVHKAGKSDDLTIQRTRAKR